MIISSHWIFSLFLSLSLPFFPSPSLSALAVCVCVFLSSTAFLLFTLDSLFFTCHQLYSLIHLLLFSSSSSSSSSSTPLSTDLTGLFFFKRKKKKKNRQLSVDMNKFTSFFTRSSNNNSQHNNSNNNNNNKGSVQESSSDDDSSQMETDSPSSSESMSSPAISPRVTSKVGYNLGNTVNHHAKVSDFDFLKMIGKGSFGKVMLAKHREEKQTYAVKVLEKKMILKKNEKAHIMCERNVLLKNLNHPFLVGLRYSFQSSDKLYFVLDYVNGGELFFHLQKERHFTEPRARFYSAEITSALGYLHSEGIVYRDLKPENILLDREGHIVLTDFGLCKDGIRGRDTTNTFCGTPEYLAPEVIRKEQYDRTVDWWCFGAVLYEMIYGLVSGSLVPVCV